MSVEFSDSCFELGSCYFRWQPLCKFTPYKLRVNKIAFCLYGGPTAFFDASAHCIYITSASGYKLYSTIKLENTIKFGPFWTLDEHLVIISHGMYVYIYGIDGSKIKSYRLVSSDDAIDCRLTNQVNTNGSLVVAKSNLEFQVFYHVQVDEYISINANVLREDMFDSEILIWCTAYDDDKSLKIIFAHKHTIYTTDIQGVIEHRIPQISNNNSRIKMMESCLDRKLICLVTDRNYVFIMSSDLQAVFSSIILEGIDNGFTVRNLHWASPKAICISIADETSSQLILVGKDEKQKRFKINESCPYFLVSEFNGLTFIYDDNRFFLEQVPPLYASIIQNSKDSISIAYDKYMNNDEDCFMLLKKYNLTQENNFSESVQHLMACALFVTQIEKQYEFLKKAEFAYRYAFLATHQSPYQRLNLNDCIQILQILNKLRSAEYDIPLTYNQFTQVGIDVLFEKLQRRQHNEMINMLCKNLPNIGGMRDNLMLRWIYYQINNISISDEQILENVLTTEDHAVLCFSTLSNYAVKFGRTDLALQLINKEPDDTKRIKGLLVLHKYEQAMNLALSVGNPEQIQNALRVVDEASDRKQYHSLLHKLQISLLSIPDLKISLCNEDICADFAISKALSNVQNKMKSPGKSIKEDDILQLVKSLSNKPDESSYIQILNHELALMNFYRLYDIKNCYSATQALEYLFNNGNLNAAQELRKISKMSNKVYNVISIQSMIKRQDILSILKVTKSVARQIGLPFLVKMLVNANFPLEAEHFLEFSKDTREKLECLIALRDYKSAADLALHLNDDDLMQRIVHLTVSNSI
ncbi:hypothetical protein GJ496_000501 [Pomphorhynchus laevis]|nr:hypothetical protein GJ496_000501 [Pomphorhynchus laevis]